MSRLNRLGSHLSPSGTECYITSDMFYVEVQLDTGGQLVDVKVAHQGENPTVSLQLHNSNSSPSEANDPSLKVFAIEVNQYIVFGLFNRVVLS